MTPAEQAAREPSKAAFDAIAACQHAHFWEGLCPECVDQVIEQARREEREACAEDVCERCRTTPHLPAFRCAVHGDVFCHESGVHGWGHYVCHAAAIRAHAALAGTEGKDRR